MAEKKQLIAYLNGKLVPREEALGKMGTGNPRSAGGLYDAERTFGGLVFKLRAHLERLYRSLEFARMDPGIGLEEMEAATLEVLEANRQLLGTSDDFILGQVVTAGQASCGNGHTSANVVIYCQPIDFAAFAQSYVRGVRLVTPVTYSVPAQASTTEDVAVQETFPLMMDDHGNITESRHANFMFVRDGRIKLPNRDKVLPGISMETVLELADSLGVAVDEDDYDTGHVYEADEAFVSGTRYCLLPAATINGMTIGHGLPGAVTSRLSKAWSDRVGADFVEQALSHVPPEQFQTRVDQVVPPFDVAGNG